MGIEGNENAHALARASLLCLLRESRREIPHLTNHDYARPPIGDADRAKEMETDYDPEEERQLVKLECREKLRELLPDVLGTIPRGFGRRERIILTRIQTNTTCTPARIASWSRSPSSSNQGRCNFCNDNTKKGDQTHLIWDCPGLEACKRKHKPTEIIALEGWTHPPGPCDKPRKT
ncbi:unnamed protein product, partial [Ixodes pacificus]